jgi:hydrogenase nickel incorporation protein HypA/HybF
VHELSIALGIVDAVAELREAHGSPRIRAVHLLLGPLSGVAKEALLFAYPIACEGSGLEGSELVIVEDPIVAFCPACQARRPVSSATDRRCEECGTPATQLVGGRALSVTAMEVEP